MYDVRMIRRLAILVLLHGALLGNGQPTSQKVFKVPVDLVLTHAFVTDGNQRPIAGLKAEDFLITDDGAPQQISVFKPETEPFRLLLAMDASGSTHEKIEIIRAAAKKFLKQLGPGDEIGLLEFGDTVRLAARLNRNRRELEKAIDHIGDQPARRTKLHDALAFALRVAFKGTQGRNALVLLSDGMENASGIELDALNRYLAETDCLIYSLVVDTEEEYSLLLKDRLRRESRFGLVLDSSSPKNERLVKEAARDIATQFCETSYIYLLARNCRNGGPIVIAPRRSCPNLLGEIDNVRPSADWSDRSGSKGIRVLAETDLPFFVVTDTIQGLERRVDPCILPLAQVLDTSRSEDEWRQVIPRSLDTMDLVRSLRAEISALPEMYANARSNMKTMATVTGGRVYQLDSVKQLDEFYQLVAQELRCVYTLGFYPSKSTPGLHSLKVVARKPGLAVRARTVYQK